MLRSAKDVRGYALVATDGELGSVHDLYFDDETWMVRYVVVDTGNWLPGRRVLISPVSVNQPDWVARQMPVSLTREQVKNSPSIDTHKPVSRQHELEQLRYYGYPPYWVGPAVAGSLATPAGVVQAPQGQPASAVQVGTADSHLRSCREVAGYHLHATDGELGHVDDFLFGDLDWAVRYVEIDTSNWWFGRKVLVAPEWIDTIDWQQREVRVDVSRDAVQRAPQYDAVAHVNRQWETDYYAHHQRPPYWISPERARAIKARYLRPPVITK
jgi:PRC-barrel domain